MKKLFLIFAFSLFVTPAFAADMEAQELKSLYMKSCLVGGDKEICLCSFDRAKSTMKADDFQATVRSVSAGIPGGYKQMRMFNKATAWCARKYGKLTDEQRKLLEPEDPIGTPVQETEELLVPPPPPPPLGGTKLAVPQPEKKEELSGDYLSEEVDKAEKPVETPKPKKKKSTAKKDTKKKPVVNYFGQYDAQYFDATKRGDIEALRALTPEIPGVDLKDQSGNTPLITSAVYGKETSMKFLLANGADVNIKNAKGQTALHVASFIGRPDLVEMLLTYASDPNQVYGNGLTPLMLATMRQDDGSVYQILKYKALPNAVMQDGNTALHIAAGGTNMKIIAWLVSYQASINMQNNQGYTPLMIAAYNGNMTAAKTLLGYKADPYARDKAGRMACNLAQIGGHFELAQFLGCR